MKLMSLVCALLMFGLHVRAQAEESDNQPVKIDSSFPLAKVAGSSGRELESMFGAPKWEKTKYGPKGIYLDGAVEVVFIKDKADWITVYPSNLAFDASAVRSYLGLAKRRPSHANEYSMRWERKDGYLEVEAFPKYKKKGVVDMLYIKTTTK